MALLVCNRCTTKFAVGAPYCPHCTSTDHREDGEDMAKITVHGGVSDVDAVPGQPGYQAPAEAAPARLDTLATRDLDAADALLASAAGEVPDGTVAEVLAWVDGDPERAERAHWAELQRDNPRTTLVAELERLVAG